MPLYEYRCPGCQHVTSLLWRNYFPPDLARCEACGNEAAERRISTFAFHKSMETKMAELDPKYDKMVDEALKRSPASSDPQYHLNKMGPFEGAPD